ncbi:MAG: S-methyl-5-thioribose-1-phosphate isomerase [Alphaproteobacteria bacterium]|nr:S-methyl-5-thioribose-1-phosphate isomerase [Alphaproteobacteria bacterium]MCB1839915.1 S-methyl-5-thioribose-1-phosphate isomerase [Alphaproteobacteria bacterium]
MKINGKHYRSIEVLENGWSVRIFDQRKLPWELAFVELTHRDQAARAIREMWTRGAPLLAATGVYGLCLALREDASDGNLKKSYDLLLATRPTAVNLRWALDEMIAAVKPLQGDERVKAAYRRAQEICDEDVEINRRIGLNGLPLLREHAKKNQGRPVNILTHCNAGWLATVDYGTVTSPIYMAHDEGIRVHVWVDETRPRNQGASLTAFELAQHGVPHTVIADNAGGHLMQRGEVDLCIVGTDRVVRNGDVCNKIGTYLKALAAYDNNVPFYVALPYPTIDYTLESGEKIPIEERSAEEVTHIEGQNQDGKIEKIKITQSPAANPAFDITPARYVAGYITERGLFKRIPESTGQPLKAASGMV